MRRRPYWDASLTREVGERDGDRTQECAMCRGEIDIGELPCKERRKWVVELRELQEGHGSEGVTGVLEILIGKTSKALDGC